MREFCAFLLGIAIIVAGASAASMGYAPDVRDGLFDASEVYTFDYSSQSGSYWDDVSLSLLTVAPAEPVYIYFGHTGVLLSLPGQEDRLFDYGTFGFGPGFFTNFARGLLYYDLSSGKASRRLERFEEEDRTMSLLSFGFTPEEKKGVTAFLEENSKPENTTYLYHYYKDNCATRVRDIYDAAKGGDFRQWAESISTEKSYRDYARPYLSPSLFFNLFLNYLQGPGIDYSLTLWEAMFLPDTLRDSIAEYNGESVDEIYTTSARKDVPESYALEPRALAVGLILAAVIMLASSRHRALRTFSDIASGLFYTFLGLASALLIFMMLFTNHDVTYGNINWLIISPLNLFSGINRLRSLGRNSRRPSMFVFSGASIALALIALTVQVLTPFAQANAPYYLLSLCLYIPEYYFVDLVLDRRHIKEETGRR